MIIKEVLQSLEVSQHPIARVLYKKEHCKALIIGFKKGMILKEHQTAIGGKLTVLKGNVLYKQENIFRELNEFDEIEIPANTLHSVTAMSDSLCLLIL